MHHLNEPTPISTSESGSEKVAERRQLLRTMGGALAGIAASVALCPNEAQADTRPTLNSLDQRVADLEAALSAVIAQVGPLFVDGAIQIGTTNVPATGANAGLLRWNPNIGQLEVSDGNQWRPVALQ